MTKSFDSFEEMAASYTAAWNSGDPAAVADHYAPGKGITINRGANQFGREAMLAMAGGFMADIPGMKLVCDFARCAGDRAVYAWTFEGNHSGTGNFVKVSGWEEWTLGEGFLVTNSLGWFDGEDYDRQVAGG